MLKKTSSKDLVFLGGLIGILGALLAIVSDFILLGRPVSAYSFFKLGTESMAGLSQWRITTGSFLGIIVIPLQIAGLITIYYGLKPGGKLISLVVVIITAYTLIMGIAFHISYAYIGSGWKFFHEPNCQNAATSELIKRFDYYLKIIFFIILISISISSIVYTYIILKGNTLYPKWMSILNPLCISLFIYFLVFVLPAPVGGFIAPACLNLATLVFLSFSTVITYRRIE